MNIYQSNKYGKDLLNLDDEPSVQERQQVKEERSYIFVSVVYLTDSSST